MWTVKIDFSGFGKKIGFFRRKTGLWPFLWVKNSKFWIFKVTTRFVGLDYPVKECSIGFFGFSKENGFFRFKIGFLAFFRGEKLKISGFRGYHEIRGPGLP